jgi:hypothetical protein
MTFCILCGINSNHSDIKKKGGYILKIITKLYVARNDDSDDMEYTEDAIDNMILEFSGD